jgi:hypothetical protein
MSGGCSSTWATRQHRPAQQHARRRGSPAPRGRRDKLTSDEAHVRRATREPAGRHPQRRQRLLPRQGSHGVVRPEVRAAAPPACCRRRSGRGEAAPRWRRRREAGAGRGCQCGRPHQQATGKRTPPATLASLADSADYSPPPPSPRIPTRASACPPQEVCTQSALVQAANPTTGRPSRGKRFTETNRANERIDLYPWCRRLATRESARASRAFIGCYNDHHAKECAYFFIRQCSVPASSSPASSALDNDRNCCVRIACDSERLPVKVRT